MKRILVNQRDAFDFEMWKEADDLEFKLAAGRDGRGALPDSVWATYSAMANTAGGRILLGVKERPDGRIEVMGVPDVDKVIKEFWCQINNPQKVSANLLSSKQVTRFEADGKTLIGIKVPRASRKERPIYVGSNPLTGTYRRQNDGDFRCPTEVVQQMMAEKVSDTLDAGIWNHYSMEDIDADTLTAYRQMFANLRPVHPFNEMRDVEFLRNLGGWREDRESGEKGLTTAGLLMFGKLRSIWDVFPNYNVDYREYGRQLTEGQRWDDRVTTDFTWPGNLFSFCRIVLPRLYQSLKVPFRLDQEGVRVDESPVHIALREALVNALIHADYGEGGAILVVKRPDLFGFRNPGTLRIRKEDAVRGGTMNSDCRNRNLQKMFQMIGYADQAGSGFPKIYSGWASQDWKKPEFREDFNLSQTYLALRMTSLLPEDAVAAATAAYGSRFLALPQLERLAVVTAFAEEEVNHSRLAELCTNHPADISNALRGLVQNGFLESSGHGRGTVYRPYEGQPEDPMLGEGKRDQASPEKGPSSPEKGPSSPEKGPSSPEKGPSSPEKGPSLPEKGPSSPEKGPSSGQTEFYAGNEVVHWRLNKGRRDCLALLVEGPQSAADLRARLDRSNATKFRNHILIPLLKVGLIEPTMTPRNHPKQQYRITESGKTALREKPTVPGQ